MDGGRLLRAARRRAGLSQRALAARCGVSLSTVAAVEAGHREPGLATLNALLRGAGLELGLQSVLPPACPHLRRYLRLSLVERLYLAVGGRWHPVLDRRLVAWTGLWALAGTGRVELRGTTAVGVWAPVRAGPVEVDCTLQTDAPPTDAPSSRGDRPTVLGPASGCAALLPVRLHGRTLFVPTPELLVEQVDDPAAALSLRVAARLLDDEPSLDDGSRRAPAHRDPDGRADDHRLLHTRSFGRLPFPPAQDRRGWRLDGPVSLAQWLREYGYPT